MGIVGCLFLMGKGKGKGEGEQDEVEALSETFLVRVLCLEEERNEEMERTESLWEFRG